MTDSSNELIRQEVREQSTLIKRIGSELEAQGETIIRLINLCKELGATKQELASAVDAQTEVACYNELIASGLSDAEARGTAWPAVCDMQAQVERLTEERDSANRRLGRQIQDTQDRISALQQRVSALRDALFNARKKATEIVDEHVMARGQSDPDVTVGHARLWGASRVRNEVSTIIDAALAQPPAIKGALAKMSPQLRNVLYDLIRKVPPLADHGDQQAMTEFIAEVKP